ncbi:MAG: hypothetical protein ACYCZX_16715 [Rhodospirillaceae bacterium]
MRKIIAIIIAAASLGACAVINGRQEEQSALEKRACAELGLDPDSAAGYQCAHDLYADLVAVDSTR